MLTRALGLLIVVVLASCGGEKSAAEGAKKPEKVAEGERPSPEGKKWGGWRWKGARDDCFYKHDGRCYSSMKMACRRARCGDRECLKDDGAPASVYCQGDEPKKQNGSAGKDEGASSKRKKERKAKPEKARDAED